MNWVLIIVLFVLAVSAILGYYKGVLRIAYSLAAWVIVLVFVTWAAPHINRILAENTSMDEKLLNYCEETLRLTADAQTDAWTMESGNDLTELGIQLPGTVLERILQKADDTADDFLEESGAYEKMAHGLAGFLMNGICFMIALLLSWIVVGILSQAIGIVSKIPVIKGVNQLLGFWAGGIYGLVLVWIGFYLVALTSAGETGRMIVSYIYQSPLLTYLYENNLVLTLILRYF